MNNAINSKLGSVYKVMGDESDHCRCARADERGEGRHVERDGRVHVGGQEVPGGDERGMRDEHFGQ